MIEHKINAFKVVKSGAAKIAAGSDGFDVVAQLNFGTRLAVGDPNLPAFIQGTVGTASPGQVSIAGLDALNKPQAGTAIIVAIVPVTGTIPSEYPEGPKLYIFTPE